MRSILGIVLSSVVWLGIVRTVLCAFTVVSCPRECSCSNDHLYIDCRRRHLTKLPSGIPTLVQTLLLDDNFLELSDELFESFRILQVLSLSKNRIRNLPGKVFNGLNNLKVLRLSHNDLDYIENVNLERKSLGRLLTLDLSYNRQMELPVKMMQNLRSLQLLNVSYNQITDVRLNYAFKNTPSLRTIDLTGNKLLWLRDSPFHIAKTWYDHGASNGVVLNLTDCNIMSIAEDTFTDFKSIQSLTLSGNRIMDKSELGKIYKNLEQSHIQELNLARMGISDVRPLNDVKLLFLSSLDLSNNTIGSVARSFAGLISVRLVNLEGNRLRTLDGVEDLVSIVRIRAARNDLTTLETSNTANLTRLRDLDLRSNQISELRSSLLGNAMQLRELDLSWNEIIDLTPLAHLQNVNVLKLSRNRIANITVLKNLKALTYVDLSFNHIKTVVRYTFTNEYQLKFLNLSDNWIEDIERGSFGEHSPVIVDVSRNRIATWHDVGFVETRRLYLRNNRIKTIEADSFQKSRSLLLLDLAENRIRFLNSSLSVLDGLSYLDLSHNPMDNYLDSKGNGQIELSHLRRLKVLGLSSTGMRVVRPKLTQSMPYLRQLDLSKNKIIALNPSLLTRQLQLQFLNLSNNRLQSVNRKSFQPLSRLQILDISNNPFHCTCELLRFIRWTFTNNITIMNMDKEKLYRCVWPQAWTDLPMAELHFHMDNCLEDGDKVIVYIAVGFLVILVGLAVVLTCYFIKCCIQPEPVKRRDSYDELDGEDNETSWV